MKILIDYDTEVPSEELIKHMDLIKAEVMKRLQPIKNEIGEGDGVLLLHTDGSFEAKDIPAPLYNRIIDHLKPSF